LLQFFDPRNHKETLETLVVVPVFENNKDTHAKIVGHYFAVVPWYVYFQDELPDGTAPIHAVIESSCGHTFTFAIAGRNATLVSSSQDAHDHNYNEVYMQDKFGDFSHSSCNFTLTIFPTHEYHEQYNSSNPTVYMIVVLSIFLLTTLSFLLFDCLVTHRQKELVATARKQNALVSSLFPVSSTCFLEAMWSCFA
jgi:hypothetical protein